MERLHRYKLTDPLLLKSAVILRVWLGWGDTTPTRINLFGGLVLSDSPSSLLSTSTSGLRRFPSLINAKSYYNRETKVTAPKQPSLAGRAF